MKKIFVLLFALVSILSVPLHGQQKPAEMKFDRTTLDFGKFTEERPEGVASFTFTNTGNRPLVIVEVYTSCGCTNAEYPEKPINPGEKGFIKVKYNSIGTRAGKFSKNITVYSNASPSTVRLTIKGEMVIDKEKKNENK